MTSSNFFIIPEDYRETQKDIIPICIRRHDEKGDEIDPRWITQGVEPIYDDLVRIAKAQLGDPGRGSEIAEVSVHDLWRRYRADLGIAPHRRVLRKAVRTAARLRTGDWRRQRYPKRYLDLDALDARTRDNVLPDPRNYPQLYEHDLMLTALTTKLQAPVLTDTVELLIRGLKWPSIAAIINAQSPTDKGTTPEALRKRFFRAARA